MATSTINYGVDFYCITDLTQIDVLVTDPAQLVGQRVVRRLTTPRGAFAPIGDDPNFGFDCRQYVNAKLGPNDIANAQAAIQSEVLKDEEVLSATATLTLSGGNVSVTVTGTLSTGPFSLTLSVSAVTTTALFNFGS